MAKNKKQIDELTLDEAINAVKKLSNPDRPNQELELLKEASSKLLEEVQPGFEFEGDDDDGPDTGALKEELTKSPGFFEQVGSQLAMIGPAGLIALTSAAYFQIDTVVEETRTVAAVAEKKWEEVKLEHPNINWDDPLAGFTAIIGVGNIDIDLDPPEPKVAEPTSAADEESQDVKEEKPKPQVEEVSESPTEKESEEPEPEAEEQVEEKPKKKKGLFSFLTGGDDDSDESDSKEKGEPTQDGDTISNEQAEKEPTEERKAEAPESKDRVRAQPTESIEGTDVAEANVVEAPKIDIQEFSDAIQSGDIQLGNEPNLNTDAALEKVVTPFNDVIVVSPSGSFNIASPNSPAIIIEE